MIMILQLDVQVVHKVLESASAQKAPTVQYSVLQQGENCINSLGHHHFDELLVVDLSISINVGFANHFIHLFIGKLLAKVGHHMPQLRSTDNPLPSRSKTLNASMSSSSVSVSFILRAIKERNSGKSMVPLPSASTSPC